MSDAPDRSAAVKASQPEIAQAGPALAHVAANASIKTAIPNRILIPQRNRRRGA
jgi:hypothetical protein